MLPSPFCRLSMLLSSITSSQFVSASSVINCDCSSSASIWAKDSSCLCNNHFFHSPLDIIDELHVTFDGDFFCQPFGFFVPLVLSVLCVYFHCQLLSSSVVGFDGLFFGLCCLVWTVLGFLFRLVSSFLFDCIFC